MNRFRWVSILIMSSALVASACGGSESASGSAAEGDSASDSVEVDRDEGESDEPGSDEDESESDEGGSDGEDVSEEDKAKANAAVSAVFDSTPTLDESVCLVEKLVAAGLLDEAADDASFESLDDEQQVDVVDATISCAPRLVAEELASDASIGSAIDAANFENCLTSVHDDKGRDLSSGLQAVAEEVPGGPDGQEAVVALFDECISGESMAQFIAESAAADPAMADAVDSDCLGGSFSEPGALSPLWQAVVANPGADFEELDPETTESFMGPFFDCISFGQVMAGAASEDGVTLSDSSIACIDEELAGEDLLGLFLADTPAANDEATATMGAVTVSCLSPEEIGAMGGAGG